MKAKAQPKKTLEKPKVEPASPAKLKKKTPGEEDCELEERLESTAPPSIKDNPEYQELMRRKAVLPTGGQDGEGAGHCQGLLRGDQGFEQSLL